MKTVMKVLAAVLATAAAICAVIVFWENITQGVGAVTNKVRSRRQYAEGCVPDDEDYTDWDE